MRIIDCKELALKKVKINGNVIGKFGCFEIEQTFFNNTEEILEVGYTFPIVETATVVGFEVKIGDKILKGKCKEKEAAQKEYQTAMVEGNSAYLMEQKNDNIFKIFVGKLGKNEEVKIKINYIDKFEIVDNTIKILIPTLVVPKYKSDITSNLEYGKIEYTVDFNIYISKNVNRKSINCVSHKINLIDEENQEKIEVLDYDLSRDFKLDIELKKELTSNAIISKTRDDNQMLYLSFMPEILDSYEDSEKEYIFLVDISGSMTGIKIEETKRAVIECLKQLDVGDKFNILAFETEFEAMSINALDYNEENFQKAVNYIEKLKTLGGTEILNPIKFALSNNDQEKIILLFTDGQVGNEQEILDYVKNNINTSRLFPFGIDSNVNSSFIRNLGKYGKGKAELIRPKEKIDDKIIRTFARIQTPLVQNLEINYGKNKLLNEIKEENSLFNYDFFNVFVKIEKLEDDIELKGNVLSKEYSWKISKDEILNSQVDLEILFVKQEMDRIEEYISNTRDYEKIKNYKEMIIERAEKYNINSKYTSFLTVYEREDKIFEVPTLQETRLSSRFSTDAMFDSYECFDIDNIDALGRPQIVKTCKSRIVMVGNSNFRSTSKEILKKQVDRYFEKFINEKEKSVLTYILLVYLYWIENKINYDEFIKFLKENQEEILSNELYMNLLYMHCRNRGRMKGNENAEILNLLSPKYKVIANTMAKLKINLKEIDFNEVKEIVENNLAEENINDVIWWLICQDTKKY